MPKPSQHASRPCGPAARSRIDEACRRAVLGKLALRDLARWVAGSGVSEIEFRLLWLLQTTPEAPATAATTTAKSKPAPRSRDHAPSIAPPNAPFNQAELAARLAVSTAQVSAVVERLRAAGHVCRAAHTGDRRRQLWSLTPAGRGVVRRIIAAVDELPPIGLAEEEAA